MRCFLHRQVVAPSQTLPHFWSRQTLSVQTSEQSLFFPDARFWSPLYIKCLIRIVLMFHQDDEQPKGHLATKTQKRLSKCWLKEQTYALGAL